MCITNITFGRNRLETASMAIIKVIGHHFETAHSNLYYLTIVLHTVHTRMYTFSAYFIKWLSHYNAKLGGSAVIYNYRHFEIIQRTNFIYELCMSYNIILYRSIPNSDRLKNQFGRNHRKTKKIGWKSAEMKDGSFHTPGRGRRRRQSRWNSSFSQENSLMSPW